MSKETPVEQADPQEARLAALVREAAISLPSEAARARTETSVHAAWREALRDSGTDEIGSADSPSASRRRLRVWSMAAGVAAIAVFAGFAWRANAPQAQVAQLETIAGPVAIESAGWFAKRRSVTSASPIALKDEITAGANAIATLRVPSGLAIRVRAGTRVAFNSSNALVLKRGTIYVDAVRGSDPMFAVETPIGTVRHLGTQYQVEVDEDRVAVVVRDGSVAVMIDGRAEERATAGSVVSIGLVDRQVLRASIATHDERFAWIEAQPSPFVLDGARLSDFLAWFTRETGIEVRFSPALSIQQLKAVTLRGSIEGLAPLKALDVVLASIDLTYAHFDSAIVIAAR